VQDAVAAFVAAFGEEAAELLVADELTL